VLLVVVLLAVPVLRWWSSTGVILSLASVMVLPLLATPLLATVAEASRTLELLLLLLLPLLLPLHTFWRVCKCYGRARLLARG
jgi:hypothetical protein